MSLLRVKLLFNVSCPSQRVLTRQEELKERARLLLEQARRDAAVKAGNKNNPNAGANAANRTTNICDVSRSDGSRSRPISKESALILRWEACPVQRLTRVGLPLRCVRVQHRLTVLEQLIG